MLVTKVQYQLQLQPGTLCVGMVYIAYARADGQKSVNVNGQRKWLTGYARTEKTAKAEFRTNAGRQNNAICRTSADKNHNLSVTMEGDGRRGPQAV